MNAARKMADKYGDEKFVNAMNDTRTRAIIKIGLVDTAIAAVGMATTAAIIANMKD